ncbi:MAG: hypothetical protein NBV68_18740, partial [Erythrobacter sp.]|nr:hypothetical protein [Erythrobacter sp.]
MAPLLALVSHGACELLAGQHQRAAPDRDWRLRGGAPVGIEIEPGLGIARLGAPVRQAGAERALAAAIAPARAGGIEGLVG